ncbi:hypothetical protein [Streptomyces liangshanensis]
MPVTDGKIEPRDLNRAVGEMLVEAGQHILAQGAAPLPGVGESGSAG